MKAYFSEVYLAEENISLPPDNRAFLYGDGFFETMLGHSGKVKYLNYHLSRIRAALKSVWIEPPEELDYEQCAEIIHNLFRKNNIHAFAKVKIHAWRKKGGNYLPHNSDCHLLATIREISRPPTGFKRQVCFSEKVKNQWSQISRFKSSSAQNYILAALEMKANQADEIIISDNQENISECLVSNIFWVKDGEFFTPSLQTGCVEGISRKVIIEELASRKIPLKEVIASQEDLLAADSIFCTNATGLSHILKIGDTTHRIFHEAEDIYRPWQ